MVLLQAIAAWTAVIEIQRKFAVGVVLEQSVADGKTFKVWVACNPAMTKQHYCF